MLDTVLIIAFNERWAGISRLPSGLDRAGFTVYALCPKDSYLGQTKYLKKVIFFPYMVYRSRTKLMYLWMIMSICWFKPDLIIPADENTIKALHRLSKLLNGIPVLKRISLRIRKSMSPIEYDSIVLNKSDFQTKCNEWGLRSPKNVIVANLESALLASKEFQFPLVLKHDVGAGGVGVFICQDEEELKNNFYQAAPLSIIKKIKATIKKAVFISHSTQSTQVSLQEFIDGKLGVAAFSALNGKVLAVNTMLTLKTNPEKTGPTSVAEGFNNLEIKSFIAVMVKNLNYSGFGALDFIYEEKSGKVYIIEFNARPTPSCHLANTVVTNDLCEVLFKGLNSKPISLGEFKPFMIAMFPAEKKRDPNSPFLNQAFHDIPINDPRLLEILDS